MGVYIKGMEMPKSCEFCPCMCEVDTVYQTACGCKLTMKIREIDNDMRPDWCPLVPVPPHGRLIDADAMIERIEFEVRHYVVKDEFDKGRVAAWNNVIRAIREYAPTIIPAEEG